MIKLRQADSYGSGAFGASRGGRLHRGVDVICTVGEQVCSLTYGVVTKIGYPYSDPKKSHLRYVEVTLDGNRFRYFYIKPTVNIGDKISPDDPLGISLSLQEFYPKITPHYHFEIIDPSGEYINPNTMLDAFREE